MPDLPASRPAGIASLIFAVLFIGLFYWSSVTDPCTEQALAFIRSSPELAARLGHVQDASVRRRLKVGDAISVDDRLEPGYRSYDVQVKGARTSALVTVRAGLKDCTPRIASIETRGQGLIRY